MTQIQHGHAQGPNEPKLEIVGDLPGCVSAASLRARVRELLAGQSWPDELSVELQLGAAQPRFSISNQGRVFAERRFERLLSSCGERRDALAVAIVFAVENYLAGQSGSAAEPVPVAESGGVAQTAERLVEVSASEAGAASAALERREPARSPQADAQRDTDPSREGSEALQPTAAGSANLYAGGQWLWAAAPGTTAALAVGAELNLGDVWSVGVGGLWAPPAEHVLGEGPKRVAAQLFAGQLFGCWNARGQALIFQACGGATAGVLDAEGRGFQHKNRVPLAWGALLLRAAAQWPSQGALAVRARADARVNVLRPEPEVAGPGGFSAPVGVFGADLGIDLLWRLH